MLEWCSISASDQQAIKTSVQSRADTDESSQQREQRLQRLQSDSAPSKPETAQTEKSLVEERVAESSSGMVTMSMDMSVTMDISEQQEQSMDMTLDHSVSAMNAPAQDSNTTDTLANQHQISTANTETIDQQPLSADAFVRPDHNTMKRRRLVNSKPDCAELVCMPRMFAYSVLIEFTELDDTLDIRVRMFKEYEKTRCMQWNLS